MSRLRLNRRWLRPSISKKFALFFAILLIVVISSALVVDRSMSRLNGAGAQIDLSGSLRYLTRNVQVSAQHYALLGRQADYEELEFNLQRFRRHLGLLRNGGDYSNQRIPPTLGHLQHELSLIEASFNDYERQLLTVLMSGNRRSQYAEHKESLHGAASQILGSADRFTNTLSEQLDKTQAEIRETLLRLVLIDGAILIAGLFAVRFQIVRPLRKVERASRRIAQGHYDERLTPTSGDEIGRLARSINDMASAIESRKSELLRSRASLLRANRALRLLSSVNHTMIGATDTLELLQRMCELAVSEAGYHSAFVGRAEQNEERTITIIAAEGMPDEYRASLKLSWADNEYGRGVAGTTIREDRTYAVHSLRTNPRFAPWAQIAVKLGLEDAIGLPIRVEGKAWGVICIYSTQPASFDDEETALLQEMADDLGFGIQTLRIRQDRQALEDTLRRTNEQLEQRVVERTRALEEANKELEAFSYSVSHDLRAPLRAIDGFANLLNQDYGSSLNATGQDYLARVRRATQRMAALIDDLLDLSRISRAEMAVKEVDLTAIASDIAGELVSSDPDRRVSFEIAPNVGARGDPGLLRALLQNLLDNAWKYTGKTAEPRIAFGTTVTPQGERIFYVSDNGVGFDSDSAGRLFQPFIRLHRDEDFPGTGVGLATAARIVSRHGGRIWAQAKQGEGAVFYFTLS